MNPPQMPARPDDDAPFAEKIVWLLKTHAYCPIIDRVVRLYEPSDECLLQWHAFAREFQAWVEISTGPRGGQHANFATARWEIMAERMTLDGVRMRPDRAFPTYREAGQTFKNTFRKAGHSGSGDITAWAKFMEHLLPVAAEREWFCDWLAHKWRNPAVPGVAVAMVAADAAGRPVYGAGRGMLRDVIARLLGAKYVRPIDFNILTGKSSQAVYTDWAAYALLVTVNEAKEHADAGRWANQRATYERLKELVDPRAIERTFHPKGLPAFMGLCFASFLIFTNHPDAVQIPFEDRRFTVLSNPAPMQTEMAEELTDWMEQEGNIAEVARWLEQRDLSSFNPYMALRTAAKTTMQEWSQDELDEALQTVKQKLGRGALFTTGQIWAAVLDELPSVATANSEALRIRIYRRLRTMVRRVKGETEDLRMPRDYDNSEQRARILCWRDFEGPDKLKTMEAQKAVEHSAKVLDGKTKARWTFRLRAIPSAPVSLLD